MQRSRGPPAVLAPATASSRYDPCGRCPRKLRSCAMHDEGDKQAREVAEAVARRSYGKLVAFVSARTHDVAAAEDALSGAFASAPADLAGAGGRAHTRG